MTSSTNIFLRHTQPLSDRDKRGEVFDAFCKISVDYAKASATEMERVDKAKRCYVDMLHIAEPAWSDSIESQWKEFFLSSSPDQNNMYVRHIVNPSGRENRGKEFSLFIEESSKLVEKYDKELAIAMARERYRLRSEAAQSLARL